MNKKSLLLIGFILMVLVQLAVPSKMIWDRENILLHGEVYHFRTEPIDPNDPFRGKYITLSFPDTEVEVKNAADWYASQPVYALFEKDADGFAVISEILREAPDQRANFLKTSITYNLSYLDENKVEINLPFDRFYMEEYKATAAEKAYFEAQRDSTKTTFAVVRILDGEAVLEDVMIEGVSIKEVVDQQD